MFVCVHSKLCLFIFPDAGHVCAFPTASTVAKTPTTTARTAARTLAVTRARTFTIDNWFLYLKYVENNLMISAIRLWYQFLYNMTK